MLIIISPKQNSGRTEQTKIMKTKTGLIYLYMILELKEGGRLLTTVGNF